MSLRVMPQSNMMEGEKSEGIEENIKHATLEDLVGEEDGRTPDQEIVPEPLIRIKIELGRNVVMTAVIDTGPTHSCISHELYTKLLELKWTKGRVTSEKNKFNHSCGEEKS